MMITKVMTLESVQFLYLFSWPPIYQFEPTNRQNIILPPKHCTFLISVW